MELLAVYIDNHFLFKEPIYLNFGGEFTFKFEKVEGLVKITNNENTRHIRGFYKKGVSNISAIVGNNGVGKTSLMRILNQEPKSNTLAVYGKENKIFIQNATDNQIGADFDFKDINYEDCPFPLYYSNILDYTLKDFNSIISESNQIKDSLTDYYYDTIIRQVFFLFNKGEYLSKKYPELPIYQDISVSINNLSKSQFLDSPFYKEATIGKSISEQLKMLWNSYGYESEEMIHKNEEFLKNFEVFVLSLLVTDDTFAQTNGNGFSIGFEDILKQESFEKKLELFLKKRLDNIDGPLFEILDEKLGVKFDSIEELIDNVRADKISQIAGGFDFNKIKNHAIQTIVRYNRVFKLYDFIKKNNQIFQNSKKSSELILKVNDEKTQEILKELFLLYQNVYETFQYIQFEFRVFNVSPSRKMSTGEQAILNLYGAIYTFTLKDKHHFREKNSYILLLDEPEHGYHAVWKKKFIWTLNETLPALFSNLEQNPSVQIIFTTHDALTLSDLPNDKISYLKRLDDDSIKVFHQDDLDRPSKSFGANITDLLADSFFVEDGLIGDFVKEKIQDTIKWLNDIDRDIDRKLYHKKIIKIIDEPIVQRKLSEMYDEIFREDLELEIIDTQIKFLENLKSNKDNRP
ncbi:AAA family ATPase [Kriegella aquimaris]|uniref:AAA domain-containing protein, putative AbiEii toxin, Type IV TA system n=1 Tax=Kriegella aquimaris TaxID=192904 RepID=A0A1G9LD26_9FLAO|nr:AAA family ATPase [Kriegella aquimaris]SDL59872.1 AAA domain-containing protein, putative AbiEii toxin, Type IV TA system [Kriegella aquimaris]